MRFRDSYFAATGGGLLMLSETGETINHYTVLDGLPESDLICLRVWRDRLYVGTRTKNLVVFDSEKFERYEWTDRQAQAVTVLTEHGGNLLIGTFAGGLLECNGAVFTEIKAADERIKGINCLLAVTAELYIGTFADGLWIEENDFWTHLTTAENLPSNRVVGIALEGAKVYVAADFGLAVWQDKSLRSVAVLPSLAGVVLYENRVFLMKDDGKIFTFENSPKEFYAAENQQNSRLIIADEMLWILSSRGISKLANGRIKTFTRIEKDAPTDNFVSALAFDKAGNLWLGTFRRGVDVFSADGVKIKHLESETVREINFLQSHAEAIFAATASGAQIFKSDFSVQNQTTETGLPGNSITHFSGDYTATSKGLAFRENGKIRLLSTVNGLPNNSVYTTLQVGAKLYAGTLGGLAETEASRVVRTYKDSNSNLKTNRVTALIETNTRVFIGTYGGGIFELLPSGEIRSFESETGKFVVNPNALFSDGERLYAGTLAGVKILDLKTQEWKTVKRRLPAETVLSIAVNGRDIYFGTTNGIARIEKNYFENGATE